MFCVLRAQLDEGAQHTRSKAHLDGIKIQTIIMNVNNGHYAMVNASQANYQTTQVLVRKKEEEKNSAVYCIKAGNRFDVSLRYNVTHWMHSGTVCVCIVQRMVSHSKCAGKKEKTVFKTKIDIIQLTAKIIYSHELRSSLIEEETLRTRLIQKVIKWKNALQHTHERQNSRQKLCM